MTFYYKDYLILWFLHWIKLLIIWCIKCKLQSNLMSFFSSKFNLRSIWCYKKWFCFFILMKRQTRYLSIGTRACRPKLKMVTNCFRTIIFMWPMRRLNMHLGGAQFLSFRFWKGGERSFVFSVPNVFPSSFQKVFPKYPHTFMPYTMAKVELSYI